MFQYITELTAHWGVRDSVPLVSLTNSSDLADETPRICSSRQESQQRVTLMFHEMPASAHKQTREMLRGCRAWF